MAAYSNGISGAVSVFKNLGTTATLLSTTAYPDMGGIMPGVEMIDVDGDGKQEAVVSFTTISGQTTADWVLRWDGTTLNTIAPVVNGAAFMDLTGAGQMNIITANTEGDLLDNNVPANLLVYTLTNGQFTQSGTLNLFKTYSRTKGQPTPSVSTFTVVNPTGAYEMTIINGAGTANFVSSAVVTLNGTVVATPNMFNQKTKIIKIPLTLMSSNTLTVTLNSAPGSRMSIAIGTY